MSFSHNLTGHHGARKALRAKQLYCRRKIGSTTALYEQIFDFAMK